VNRTTFLAAIAVAAALMQLLPERANLIKWAAIGLAILYIGVRASLTYPKIYRDRRALASQRAADRLDYERYESESAAIRDRYASIDAADEIANTEFRTQLSALHTKYAAMLERKFGRGRLADDPLASQPIPTHDQGMKG
jgi:hypothetical protein